MPAINAVVCSTSTSSSPPLHMTSQPRLRLSFNIEDILGLNQAPTLAASVPVSSSPTSPLDQRPRRRHRRIIYTPNQLASMESVFSCNQYPDINSREALADAIDVTESRVQVWFQNRRSRQRRQGKRQTTDAESVSDTASDSRPPSAASSTISSAHSSHHTPSPASSPKSCSRPESSSPPATPDSDGPKTPTVPSPPSSSRCNLSCCSPPYSSIYVHTPQGDYVPTSNPSYGQLSSSDTYSYSAIPASFAYKSSTAAYYYHPIAALANMTSAYRQPTVFNFPAVASSNPDVSRIPVADRQTARL